MRTTVTLDPDVAALLQKVMKDRGVSFKEAVNDAVRAGLVSAKASRSFRTPTYHMGHDPRVPWDKALQLAAALEDQELTRRLAEQR